MAKIQHGVKPDIFKITTVPDNGYSPDHRVDVDVTCRLLEDDSISVVHLKYAPSSGQHWIGYLKVVVRKLCTNVYVSFPPRLSPYW